MEAAEMKRSLELTAAIAIKEAAGCIGDAREICRKLNDRESEQKLRGITEMLEPIFETMNFRARR